MAYSEFTLESAVDSLGVTVGEGDLFPNLARTSPPDWLRAMLTRGSGMAFTSEKARGEFIVAPILLAARELSGDRLAIYSGQRLDVAPMRGLSGACDFLLALSPPLPILRPPVATFVQARGNDVEAGIGQCIAQMVAAQEFNAAAGRAPAPMYGCVTTGETWQFLRLADKSVTLDARRFYLDNVPGVLGAIGAIVRAAEAGA